MDTHHFTTDRILTTGQRNSSIRVANSMANHWVQCGYWQALERLKGSGIVEACNPSIVVAILFHVYQLFHIIAVICLPVIKKKNNLTQSRVMLTTYPFMFWMSWSLVILRNPTTISFKQDPPNWRSIWTVMSQMAWVMLDHWAALPAPAHEFVMVFEVSAFISWHRKMVGVVTSAPKFWAMARAISISLRGYIQ